MIKRPVKVGVDGPHKTLKCLFDGNGELICGSLLEDEANDIAAALNAQADVAELLEAAEFMWKLAKYLAGPTFLIDVDCDSETHIAVIERWRKQVSGFQAEEHQRKEKSP